MVTNRHKPALLKCSVSLAVIFMTGCSGIEPLPDLMNQVCRAMHRPNLSIPALEFINGDSLQFDGAPGKIRGFYVPSQKIVLINEDDWDRNVIIHELAHYAGADEAEADRIEKRLARIF